MSTSLKPRSCNGRGRGWFCDTHQIVKGAQLLVIDQVIGHWQFVTKVGS